VKLRTLLLACLLGLGLGAMPAAQAAELNGAQLSLLWAVPFIGVLLSIALLPLLAPFFWHHHFGKVSAGWALALLLPFALAFGPGAAGASVVHTLLAEYIPFIILVGSLFTVAGGILVRGNLHGGPGLNTAILGIGAVLASIMGTTGASMLLIRPLLRANDNRKHAAHVVVFFIFIVSNVGGALTPLGDPPLFLGFLKGVAFDWTLRHLLPHTVFMVLSLLAIFYGLDTWWYRKEGVLPKDPTPDQPRIGVEGGLNFLGLAAIVALVLASGLWNPGVEFNVAGTPIALQALVRDLGLLAVAAASMALTPYAVRQGNEFSWGPLLEVAKLFIAIFLTMVPVLAML
jgi:Na+/H+ antiporter NhaD/arsenite permease-like protein